MLTQFRRIVESPLVGPICLQGIFGLALLLLLPCVIDEHNHDPGSIERSMSHVASCSDIVSVARSVVAVAPAPPVVSFNREDFLSPTKRFLVTRFTASEL